MVGGDGAIYAIRRKLWRELPSDAINDFLNPLQIVEAGSRAVYEPEPSATKTRPAASREEYRRRVRIVSRSLASRLPGARHPQPDASRPVHVVARLAQDAAVAFRHLCRRRRRGRARQAPGRVRLRSAADAGDGDRPRGGRARERAGPPAAGMAGYFAVIYAASAVGVVKGSIGHVSGVWTTPRGHDELRPEIGPLVPVGRLLQLRAASSSLRASCSSGRRRRSCSPRCSSGPQSGAAVNLLRLPDRALPDSARGRRPVRREPIEPTVCVFIAANNESP